VRTLRLAKRIFAAFFIIHVRKNGAAQLALFQPHAELGQIAGEGFHVRVVVLGVGPKIVAGKLTRRPGLIKGMTQQVVLLNAFFQTGQKCVRFHGFLGTTPLYDGERPTTRISLT